MTIKVGRIKRVPRKKPFGSKGHAVRNGNSCDCPGRSSRIGLIPVVRDSERNGEGDRMREREGMDEMDG